MVTLRPFAEADAEPYERFRRMAFGATDGLGPREGWSGLMAVEDGGLVGTLRVKRYHQFFGGVPVPCGGVAGVVVLPHAGGRGIGGKLLSASLPLMREEGRPVSALFPTLPQVYRRHGWEQVGSVDRVPVPVPVLAGLRSSLPIRPAGPADLEQIHALYLRMCASVDGMFDRSGPLFDLPALLELDFVHVVPGPRGLRGYLSAERVGTRIEVHDLVVDDAEAARALLSSLASWGPVTTDVTLRLGDPALELVLPRTDADVRTHPWMFRVVDLPAAVAARGWPAAARLAPLSVDVELEDPDAPWHTGRHRISWDGRRVRCEPGGEGTVHVGPRALAAWYSGAADTAALRRAGLLTGGDAGGLDALTGGPRSLRLLDEF